MIINEFNDQGKMYTRQKLSVSCFRARLVRIEKMPFFQRIRNHLKSCEKTKIN